MCLGQSSSDCNENYRSQDPANYDVPILKNTATECILSLLKMEILIVVKVSSRWKKAVWNIDSSLFLITILTTVSIILTGFWQAEFDAQHCVFQYCACSFHFSAGLRRSQVGWLSQTCMESSTSTELGIGFLLPLSTVAHRDITRQLCQQQPCNCRQAGHLKGLTASQEGLRIKSSWRKRNKKDKLANQETLKELPNYISMKGAFFFLIIHAFYLAHCS